MTRSAAFDPRPHVSPTLGSLQPSSALTDGRVRARRRGDMQEEKAEQDTRVFEIPRSCSAPASERLLTATLFSFSALQYAGRGHITWASARTPCVHLWQWSLLKSNSSHISQITAKHALGADHACRRFVPLLFHDAPLLNCFEHSTITPLPLLAPCVRELTAYPCLHFPHPAP
jgi:hypothetical protein